MMSPRFSWRLLPPPLLAVTSPETKLTRPAVSAMAPEESRVIDAASRPLPLSAGLNMRMMFSPLHVVAEVDTDDVTVIVTQLDVAVAVAVGIGGPHAEVWVNLVDQAQIEIDGRIFLLYKEEGLNAAKPALFNTEGARQAQLAEQAQAA